MRTAFLLLIPLVLFVGLLAGVHGLRIFMRDDAPCAIGSCPEVLYEGDTGKTFVYPVRTRFTIDMDRRKNPQLDVVCTPEGVVQSVPDPSLDPPLYATTYIATSPGTCTFSSNTFAGTVIIR